MNKLRQLEACGQSPWLDYLKRSLIEKSELRTLIARDGLKGVTSNPSIFEKAIGETDEYADALKQFQAQADHSISAIYEHLAIADIRAAADELGPVYEQTHGRDGYISLECSPYLANDTEATIGEALRLWTAVDRPNLMVKVPATAAGVPAIHQLISRGLNINITLLFAVSARAMLAELEGSGVSLKEVTDQLVKDGVQQFADAFDKLFSAVARHRTLPDGDRARLTIGPGSPPRRSRSIDPNRLIPARQRAASQPSCPRRSLTEIAIRFKQAPYTAFQDTAVNTLRPNWLVLSIAPDGGISLQFEVKRRGPVVDLAAVKMDFHYDDWFPKEPNAGYETLIYDVMIGDPMLFMRADIVEQSWRIVQPVLDARAAEKADFTDYDSSSDGPKAADELLARAGGRAWEPVLHALERKQ